MTLVWHLKTRLRRPLEFQLQLIGLKITWSGIHKNDPKLTRQQHEYKHAGNNFERKDQWMNTFFTKILRTKLQNRYTVICYLENKCTSNVLLLVIRNPFNVCMNVLDKSEKHWHLGLMVTLESSFSLWIWQ